MTQQDPPPKDLGARESYMFDLPESQIATEPCARREDARLLELRADARVHGVFSSLPERLRAGDLLVLNDVRVVPCRLFAKKAESGGGVELLVLESRAVEGGWELCAMARSNRAMKPGLRLVLAGTQANGEYLGRDGAGRARVFVDWAGDIEALFNAAGEMPLPPYIVKRRQALGMARHEARDLTRYQTIYADEGGAVAAPTAGLHFSPEVFAALDARGIERATLRLDVGPGTFQPVRADRLDEHPMHTERYVIPDGLSEAIARTRAHGGRVIGVGTTVVRSLEDQWCRHGRVEAGTYETALFIRPGHRFGVVDGMITNFHLPGSTLIVLVAALAGYDVVMQAYREAISEGYRFYSYGDSMLVWPATKERS